jgi:magnesium-protoporphyrin IX monomethyl ester (oxidative) cyclase
VGLGIESPNPKTIELMNKQNLLDDISRSIVLLSNNDISIEGYFIIGHYSENEADTLVYPKFARSLGLKNALFFAMTPYPGTKIFEEYRSQDNITSYNRDLYNNFWPVVKTRAMSTARLMTMMVYCYVAFFSYRSMMLQKNERGMLIIFLRDLYQFVFLALVNRSLGKQEIESTICEAYECFADREPDIRYPSAKPLKHPLSLFLEASGNRRIEFRITQDGDMRVLSIRRAAGNTQGNGPVVSLEAMVELQRRFRQRHLCDFFTGE